MTATPEQIAEILASDEKPGVIGKRLGLHHLTVAKIRKGGNVGNSRTVIQEPESKGFFAANGPSTAYRDGKDCIEVMDCPTGWIPDGWTDTPAKCANNGAEHVKYDPAIHSE